ncbi:MAG: nitrous oxide reductase accessory protein NosL [Bacteroidota bacterium]|nr:nitrous oxide reductase accessory protein NosL [Bacteroidota bacterium]
MKKMNNTSRILIALGALTLIIMFFVPVWSIYLIAPQYPEGLSMQIWLDKITGQVEIINGLNHYIGMKHIKVEMFPEFGFLIYILGGFIIFALVVALTGNRKLLFAYLILSIMGGLAAMVDFYKWGYDYGHNLDPTAAIQVPGLSYQPPLIGHKKLLNFDAYSYPDTGGWIIVGVTGLFLIIWFLEWRRQKKQKKMVTHAKAFRVAALTSFLFLASCNPKPEKIVFGKDNCVECKMTILDTKFGAEILTKKGKVYKFDDTHCVAAFLERRGVELSSISKTLFVNYNEPHEFIEVKSAEFVVSSQLKSPMGGAAAFKNVREAKKKSELIEGSKTTNWATLYNILIK